MPADLERIAPHGVEQLPGTSCLPRALHMCHQIQTAVFALGAKCGEAVNKAALDVENSMPATMEWEESSSCSHPVSPQRCDKVLQGSRVSHRAETLLRRSSRTVPPSLDLVLEEEEGGGIKIEKKLLRTRRLRTTKTK